MSIRVLIAEDEHMARKELAFLLAQESDVHVCSEAETGEQLVEHYFMHEPDVIFLDVQMPGMSGVDAAKQICQACEQQPPLFIFTTAYDDYAMDAFEIEAIDYLLKPYDDQRFRTAMTRVRKRCLQIEEEGKRAKKKRQSPVSASPKLLLDDGERMVVIAPESIYYAVPDNRMLEIHTADKVIRSRMTLQELEEKLAGYAFFRTHRSYLVNLDQIEEITPWFNGTSNITLKDKQQTTIPVSRAARKALFTIFQANHS
ncbi:LytTR family DNA-binding domain-containing protein [Virgibacillus sp. LDC-1]|uniref:LytR/AlgR family response regulator transcription factor n=1 Tax=Virgibacillus sp. LDC-1 TaxID=3039856 RepID=UPI0024DE5B2D|nr:LytTR family DNA-binding domain-containing protein [Virgibacillus sp. LDC-1]